MFAQRSGDTNPPLSLLLRGRCPRLYFTPPCVGDSRRGGLQSGSSGRSHVSCSGKIWDQRGKKQILPKANQIAAPALTPARPGQAGERGPQPQSGPMEQLLLPGAATTEGTRPLPVPGGGRHVPRAGSRAAGPAGALSPPPADISTELGPRSGLGPTGGDWCLPPPPPPRGVCR